MSSKTENNLIWAKYLKDVGLLAIFCLIFHFLKGIYFSGSGIKYWESFISSTLIIGISAALICYPAFLIGIRIKKSVFWFFILSWITMIAVSLLLWLWGQNLTYYVDNKTVKFSGNYTLFGFFYEIVLAPRTFMALWATSLLGKELLSRNKK